MSQQKPDYEYDVNDKLILTTAYNRLVDEERRAFWWGVAGTLGSSFLLRKRS